MKGFLLSVYDRLYWSWEHPDTDHMTRNLGVAALVVACVMIVQFLSWF